jgi:hypothetical protein
MEDKWVYKVWARGNDYVSFLGQFEDIEDVRIRVGQFADDVVITIDHGKEDME